MVDEPILFPYSSDRSNHTGTVIAWIFLLLVESSVLVVLILIFAPNWWVRLPLLAGAVALVLWAINRLDSATRTAHRLDGDTLHLHYGADLNIAIPRSLLLSAQPVKQPLAGMSSMGARYEESQEKIVACFSGQGQILLTLSEPVPVRLGLGWGKPKSVRRFLINADDRARLLELLDLPATPPALSVAAPLPLPAPALPPAQADAPIALAARSLVRRYGEFVAVDGLELSVRQGEIYGFLGPNGAGKTTTIKMLAGLLLPNAGHMEIAGRDVVAESEQAKAALGYVPDRALLYERLTGREYLAFLAQMRGLPKAAAEAEIDRLLALLDLHGDADRVCGGYSLGMGRKLSLAAALLHRPRVLILDEPLNGLAPRSARRMKALFASLSADGVTIFLSPHDLATAESICHRVGIIHRGRLQAEGSAAELRALAAAPDLEAVFLALTDEESGGSA